MEPIFKSREYSKFIRSSYSKPLYSILVITLVSVGIITSNYTSISLTLIILMLGTSLAWFFPRQVLYLAGFSFMCLYGSIIWEISIAHFIIVFLSLAFTLKLFLGRETVSKDEIIIFSVLFVLYIFLNETIHSPNYAFGVDFIRIVGRTLIGISLAVLIQSLLRTPKSMKVLIYSMVIGISISSLMAIFQRYLGDPFWILREKMGLSNEIISPDRMPGLSADNIQFSFQLCLMIPFTYSLMLYKKITPGEKSFLFFALITTFLALALNATRSAMVGVALSLFVMGFISKEYYKLSFVIIIFIGLLTMFNLLHPRTFSAVGIPERIVAFSLALSALSEHPLGIGRHLYYSEEAYRLLGEIPYFPWVEVRYAPHNSFLDIGTYYGFPGLLISLAFYYWIFKKILNVRKHLKDPFLGCINIGMLGSFISYVVNTSFHNRGFFNDEHFGWLFVGLVLLLSKFVKERYQSNYRHDNVRSIP